MGDNKLGRLDPKTGQMTEISTGPGSLPRRIAAAPDGMLWVNLYGNGKLAKVDPASAKIVKGSPLPAGDAGPYAVNVDGAGIVWTNEINTDTVVRLNPATEEMRVVKLPSKNVGIRKMAVDASGRLWYMGSQTAGSASSNDESVKAKRRGQRIRHRMVGDNASRGPGAVDPAASPMQRQNRRGARSVRARSDRALGRGNFRADRAQNRSQGADELQHDQSRRPGLLHRAQRDRHHLPRAGQVLGLRCVREPAHHAPAAAAPGRLHACSLQPAGGLRAAQQVHERMSERSVALLHLPRRKTLPNQGKPAVRANSILVEHQHQLVHALDEPGRILELAAFGEQRLVEQQVGPVVEACSSASSSAAARADARVDLQDRLRRRHLLAGRLQQRARLPAHVVLVGDEARRRIGQAVRDAHVLDLVAERLLELLEQLLVARSASSSCSFFSASSCELAEVELALGDRLQRLAVEFVQVATAPTRRRGRSAAAPRCPSCGRSRDAGCSSRRRSVSAVT